MPSVGVGRRKSGEGLGGDRRSRVRRGARNARMTRSRRRWRDGGRRSRRVSGKSRSASKRSAETPSASNANQRQRRRGSVLKRRADGRWKSFNEPGANVSHETAPSANHATERGAHNRSATRRWNAPGRTVASLMISPPRCQPRWVSVDSAVGTTTSTSSFAAPGSNARQRHQRGIDDEGISEHPR